MTVTVNIAWAAGFLEGEGSFGCPRTSPTVQCSQVQREPLERLQRLFGGNIYECGRARKKWKGYHVWSVYGEQAKRVMYAILPLMSPRREGQIMVALNKALTAKPKASQVNKAKTHCPSGHVYSAQNTYIQPNGSRRCRACATQARAKSERRSSASIH